MRCIISGDYGRSLCGVAREAGMAVDGRKVVTPIGLMPLLMDVDCLVMLLLLPAWLFFWPTGRPMTNTRHRVYSHIHQLGERHESSDALYFFFFVFFFFVSICFWVHPSIYVECIRL